MFAFSFPIWFVCHPSPIHLSPCAFVLKVFFSTFLYYLIFYCCLPRFLSHSLTSLWSTRFFNLFPLLIFTHQIFFFLAIASNSFTYLSITTHSYIPFATELYSLGFSIQFHFWKCERGAMLLFVTLITLLMYHILWVSASILWLKLSWHSFWSNYWRPLISYNSHFTSFASNYCLSKRKETAEWNLYR